ncbi:DUF6414 family protein [Eisenbergiella tayi]|uniref:DUF6414 family protein n=1 Tax=Eisenbergiella tayi TaxID=1432052 RepID=UPI000848B3D8|nr:DUF6414 family protein [Eisenbergiella tayi]ODR33135.1 hypothetical protein BEI60_26220 [Eisenbergiella tayi]
MGKKKTEPKMIKVVYFDEPSARDYIDIVNGGRLDWSTEEDKEKIAKIIAEIDAEVGGGFRFLSWIKASIDGKSGAEYDRETKTAIGTKITNTLLTDYLSVASTDKNIVKFTDVVYAPENSISLYKMYSPYTIIVPKADMPIDLERLNEALENARGYYEMLLSQETPPKTVLRLNAKAFRNNYNISDLTKMNLVYYAIKVGICDPAKLDMAKEFDFARKAPTAEDVLGAPTTNENGNFLTVYDVVLAGVEL